MDLGIIRKLSNQYGSNREFVLAGGGNTSCKNDEFLYVKPSGVSLSAIKEENFVKMNRTLLRKVFELDKIEDIKLRESMVKKILSDAVSFDSAPGRPSVEAPLHEIIPNKYIVHLHPAMVNGLSCSKNSAKNCAKLFPSALYIEYVDPGFILASTVKQRIDEYFETYKRYPQVIFLENHGVFVGGDSESEINAIYNEIMDVLKKYYTAANVDIELKHGILDHDLVNEFAPQLRTLLAEEQPCAIVSLPPFEVAKGALTPDHIVYAKSFALICDEITPDKISEFKAKNGYLPKVILVPNRAVFCSGNTFKDALTVALLAEDAARVQVLAEAFGGVRYMSDQGRRFIETWESESYRKKVSMAASGGSLNGKIAVVTGGAQGFGLGIAQELLEQGATVIIADLNLTGAEAAAAMLNAQFGLGRALAVSVNVGDEESVQKMCEKIVQTCGGFDLFVSNAGVLRAGSVMDLSKKDWDFVTDINYTGYFLCVKHAAKVMARQNKHGKFWCDIVQVNSKSGLVGSNRNGAYAGSKFGTIGLTQSFALELIDFRIKVNSVCPGNFFDGPLWSDPDRGLFVQYLNSNKVPGAKTIEDVKKFYESKIPMRRGCFPKDVALAIIYAVNQPYETGQAIPVTGGQVMLS